MNYASLWSIYASILGIFIIA